MALVDVAGKMVLERGEDMSDRSKKTKEEETWTIPHSSRHCSRRIKIGGKRAVCEIRSGGTGHYNRKALCEKSHCPRLTGHPNPPVGERTTDRTHCDQPDRHEPGIKCGYPLPCPHHTVEMVLTPEEGTAENIIERLEKACKKFTGTPPPCPQCHGPTRMQAAFSTSKAVCINTNCFVENCRREPSKPSRGPRVYTIPAPTGEPGACADCAHLDTSMYRDLNKPAEPQRLGACHKLPPVMGLESLLRPKVERTPKPACRWAGYLCDVLIGGEYAFERRDVDER